MELEESNSWIEHGAQQLNWKKLKWKTRILASSFLWEGEQWAFCGASTSSPNKRASLDEELEKLPQNMKKAPLELDIKKWRVIQLKKDFCWWGGWETRKKEEWAVKEGSPPRRRRKMFGPLDSTKDLSLLQGSHQHFFSFLWLLTNPDFHVREGVKKKSTFFRKKS